MKQWLNKRVAGAAVMMAVLACPARALADDTILAPSAALACLTRVAGAAAAPVFPPELLEAKAGAELTVVLKFSGPNEAPETRFYKSAAYLEFVNEVKEFVKSYRVPCMADGAPPVSLRQIFLFDPSDGRKLMPPPLSDMNDALRKNQLSCITHTRRMSTPSYPTDALHEGMEENIVVSMRYVDPASAPEVKFIVEPKHGPLRQAVVQFAAGLRMPCLANGPNEVQRVFEFSFHGSPRFGLKDMSLMQLLGVAKEYPTPVKFDLNKMACPFDVHLSYLRPAAPNWIREIDNSDPARTPLLEWLGKITLDVDANTAKSLLGTSFTVTIPCGVVEL